MIHPPASVRVNLATSPCDMRRSFDGLHALVNAVLQLDAFAGHLFVFTRLKALVWDGSGLWVCAKRLEKGRFRWPEASEKQHSVTMRAEELAMLVNGLDLKQTQPRKWYRRSA
jgi:transposase